MEINNTVIFNERKLTFQYSLLQGLFWLRFCVFFSFSSFFLSQKGYSTAQIGLILGAANILSAVLQPLVASFADKSIKIRIKHMLIFSTIITVVAAFALFYIPAKTIMYSSLFSLVVMIMFVESPVLNTLSTEHITSGNNINYSLARSMGSLVFAFASVIIGQLSQNFGPDICITLYLGLSLIYIFILFSFASPIKLPNNDGSTDSLSLMDFVKNNKMFIVTMVSLFFILISHTLINSYLYQVVINVGGNANSLGLALGLAAFLELFSMLSYPWFKKILKRNDEILKLTAIFYFVKSLLTYLATNMGMIYVAQFLQFFGYGLYVPASVYYICNIISKQDQVKGQIFVNIALSMASFLATIIGGPLINYIGLGKTLLIGTILSGIGAIMLFRFIEPESSSCQ